MRHTREKLLKEAMVLSIEERLALSQELRASAMTAEEREIEEAWIAEAERRYADCKAGRTKAIPGEQVFRELRAKYVGRSVRTRRDA